jgi:hypothetical protein
LTSTKTSNGVYGYTYEADISTSYKVSGEANSDLDAGTLGDTSLIEVTNMKNVIKWSADDFTVDDISYDRCVDLYTPTYDLENGIFEIGDESYITINSKIDGTLTIIGDRKVLEDVPYDMELYVMNEDDGSYSSVAFTSSEAKADDGWGNYRMAYTVQLEAGKTYVLTATQATNLGFYGYTYTTYIASSDAELTEISYAVTEDDSDGLGYISADKILGENTLVNVTNMYEVDIHEANLTVNGKNYTKFIKLYTSNSTSFPQRSGYTYLTIEPQKSGTITFVTGTDLVNVVELYNNEGNALSTNVQEVSGSEVTVTVHLDAGNTYYLTSTKTDLEFYGYTFTADTSSGDVDVDHDD